MTASLFARLDREGYRVICGREACGEDIAIVVLAWPGKGPCMRILCLQSGWHQRLDSVWVLSHHAAQRLKQDRRAQSLGVGFKRKTYEVPKKVLARRPHSIGLWSGLKVHALQRPHLPAQALCHQCQALQMLDNSRLLSIDPRMPLPMCEVGGPAMWEDWELERLPEDRDLLMGQDPWKHLDVAEELLEP